MHVKALIASTLLALIPLSSQAQTSAPSNNQPFITREEFEKYKREQDQKHQEELRKLREELTASKPSSSTPPPAAASTQPADQSAQIDDLQSQVEKLQDQINSIKPGQSTFILAGDGEVGFTAPRHGPSTFDATISPLFLWQPYDRILIEAGVDLSVSTDSTGTSSTSTDLTIANISFLVNDYLAVGAGLFVVPFGQFHNHFDPPWINKFPDEPLPFGDDGIAPGSELGAFLRGAIPIRTTKLTYDLYVTNGPQLITSDPSMAGSLNFDDFTDLNNNKAVGGRIGFLPIPNLEVGYSAQWSHPSPSGFQEVDALLQAVDLNCYLDAPWASGRFTIRGEWVFSHVGRATYGSLATFGPFNFQNNRNGGYVELDYRPSHLDNKFLRNLELVTRYDTLHSPVPASLGGDTETRWTIGLDYWITPSVVFKTAYEFDNRKNNPANSAFLLQIGFGL